MQVVRMIVHFLFWPHASVQERNVHRGQGAAAEVGPDPGARRRLSLPFAGGTGCEDLSQPPGLYCFPRGSVIQESRRLKFHCMRRGYGENARWRCMGVGRGRREGGHLNGERWQPHLFWNAKDASLWNAGCWSGLMSIQSVPLASHFPGESLTSPCGHRPGWKGLEPRRWQQSGNFCLPPLLCRLHSLPGAFSVHPHKTNRATAGLNRRRHQYFTISNTWAGHWVYWELWNAPEHCGHSQSSPSEGHTGGPITSIYSI